MFGIRDSQPVRSQEDCEPGVRNNLSQNQAALKLQISKRTLQEWEQDRAAPRGLREPQSKKPFAPSAPTGGCRRKSLL
jgi:hypothetical protein